jgi:hypothetical protein
VQPPARGFFCPENGGDTFLRNVGSHKITLRHIQEDGILHLTVNTSPEDQPNREPWTFKNFSAVAFITIQSKWNHEL